MTDKIQEASQAPVADTDRCECGHPHIAHSGRTGGSTMDSWTVCRATIYETFPYGMNAWPCTCRRFVAQ